MPGTKTYNNKTSHGDFSLLACIATQVWGMDQEIKHTHNFTANKTINSPPFLLEMNISFPYNFEC